MTGWRKRTIMEMARETHLDVYSLGRSKERFDVRLEAFAKLVREEALAQPAPVQDTEAHYKAVVEGVQKLFNDKRTQPAPVQEPVAWMEMVVANLVREGVNKHKARELAKHFYSLAQPVLVQSCFCPNCEAMGKELAALKAQPEERNFCPRCGKRTRDLTTIHTCTPPQE